MSLHAPAMEPRGKVWPSSSSAPLPRLAASPLQQGSEAAPRAGGAAADALAEHMLLLDMDGDLGYDDADDACGAAEPPPQLLRPEQPPSPVPEGDDAPAAAAAAATAGSPGGSPVPSPGRGAAGGDDAAKSRSAPLAPTGFTPAEVRARVAGRRLAPAGTSPDAPQPLARLRPPRPPSSAPGARPPARRAPRARAPPRIAGGSARPLGQRTSHTADRQSLALTSRLTNPPQPSPSHPNPLTPPPPHPRPQPPPFTPPQSYIDRQERTVFFAKCAPSASVDAVARVFGAYGEIEEINLFRQWWV